MRVEIKTFGEDHRPTLALLPETGAEWALLARVARMTRAGTIVQPGRDGKPGEWDGALSFEMEIGAEPMRRGT